MVCQLTRLLHLFNINRVPGLAERGKKTVVRANTYGGECNGLPVNKISFQEWRSSRTHSNKPETGIKSLTETGRRRKTTAAENSETETGENGADRGRSRKRRTALHFPCSSLHIGAILKNTRLEHMEAIFIKVNEMQRLGKGATPRAHSVILFSTPPCPSKAGIFVFQARLTVPTRSLFPGENARNGLRLWNCYRVAHKNRLCSRDKFWHFTISQHFSSLCGSPFRRMSVCLWKATDGLNKLLAISSVTTQTQVFGKPIFIRIWGLTVCWIWESFKI